MTGGGSGRQLRTGWTTGACATAAAKAATACLATGSAGDDVEIALPSGERVRFATQRCESLEPGERAEAVVVKDAGDDPDVTNGAHLVATVSWMPGHGVVIKGGPGVGVVTLPGLGLPVGEAAINPVPRKMITLAVAEALAEAGRSTRSGIRVVISVPGGQDMALGTTNARLGVIGGISILGTTGIVRPFSTQAWRAAVERAVRVHAARGGSEIVLCTGRRSERVAIANRPDLPESGFVEVGDFVDAALAALAGTTIRRVTFFGMIGKLTKLAAGVMMTHYTGSQVDLGVLRNVTVRGGGGHDLAALAASGATARAGYEVWRRAGLLERCGELLCDAAAGNIRGYLLTSGATPEDIPDVAVAMVDFEGERVVAATRAPGGAA